MKENPRSQLKVAIAGPLFLSRVENDVKLVTSTLPRTANDREGIKGGRQQRTGETRRPKEEAERERGCSDGG